jgi:hypothetical protein
MHGFDAQISMTISHIWPVVPPGQAQMNDVGVGIEHRPPFWQGFDAQRFIEF